MILGFNILLMEVFRIGVFGEVDRVMDSSMLNILFLLLDKLNVCYDLLIVICICIIVMIIK